MLPVILCGGTGTSAVIGPVTPSSIGPWPITPKTLLQLTQRRLKGLPGLGSPILICNEDHHFIVAEQMRQLRVEPESILLEPMGRNTAPAVCVATLRAARGEDPLLLVLAADHVIRNRSFAQRWKRAFRRRKRAPGDLWHRAHGPEPDTATSNRLRPSMPPRRCRCRFVEKRSLPRAIFVQWPFHLEQRHVPVPR